MTLSEMPFVLAKVLTNFSQRYLADFPSQNPSSYILLTPHFYRVLSRLFMTNLSFTLHTQQHIAKDYACEVKETNITRF